MNKIKCSACSKTIENKCDFCGKELTEKFNCLGKGKLHTCYRCSGD